MTVYTKQRHTRGKKAIAIAKAKQPLKLLSTWQWTKPIPLGWWTRMGDRFCNSIFWLCSSSSSSYFIHIIYFSFFQSSYNKNKITKHTGKWAEAKEVSCLSEVAHRRWFGLAWLGLAGSARLIVGNYFLLYNTKFLLSLPKTSFASAHVPGLLRWNVSQLDI